MILCMPFDKLALDRYGEIPILQNLTSKPPSYKVLSKVVVILNVILLMHALLK